MGAEVDFVVAADDDAVVEGADAPGEGGGVESGVQEVDDADACGRVEREAEESPGPFAEFSSGLGLGERRGVGWSKGREFGSVLITDLTELRKGSMPRRRKCYLLGLTKGRMATSST